MHVVSEVLYRHLSPPPGEPICVSPVAGCGGQGIGAFSDRPTQDIRRTRRNYLGAVISGPRIMDRRALAALNCWRHARHALYCIRSNAQISSRSLPTITNPRK